MFQNVRVSKADKQSCFDLGIIYYIVMAKMKDIDPKIEKHGV